MITLRVSCPNCKRPQNYTNYKVKKREQVGKLRRKCIFESCGKSFKIVDNIIKELEFK